MQPPQVIPLPGGTAVGNGTVSGSVFYPTNNAGVDSAIPHTVPISTPPAAPNVNNQGIVSSSGVQQQFNNASNQIDQILNSPDPYAGLYQSSIAGLQQLAQNTASQAIGSATAHASQQEMMLNQQNAATIAGIRASNAASHTSGTVTDELVNQAQNSFNTKFNALDLAEKTAIANARNAQQSGNVKAIQEQIAYVRQAQQMKIQLADQYWKQYAFSHLSASQAAGLGIRREALNLAEGTATGTTVAAKPNLLQSIGDLLSGQPIKSFTTKQLGTGGGTQPAGYVHNGVTYTQGADGLYYPLNQ